MYTNQINPRKLLVGSRVQDQLVDIEVTHTCSASESYFEQAIKRRRFIN